MPSCARTSTPALRNGARGGSPMLHSRGSIRFMAAALVLLATPRGEAAPTAFVSSLHNALDTTTARDHGLAIVPTVGSLRLLVPGIGVGVFIGSTYFAAGGRCHWSTEALVRLSPDRRGFCELAEHK